MSGKIIKSANKQVAKKFSLETTARKVSLGVTRKLSSNHNENLALKSPARKKADVKAPIRKASVVSTKKLSSNHNEMLVIR